MAVCLCMVGTFAAKDSWAQGHHDAYMHALINLRTARWMLEHRPGNWQQSMEEQAAENQINDAIRDLKQAAIDDGRPIDDHPRMQEAQDRGGRLHAALDYLNKARNDVARETDMGFGHGIHDRTFKHIDEAIRNVQIAIHSGGAHPGMR